MNNAQLAKIEKELKKTHHVFKKNKASKNKVKNLVSFAKGLSPEQLIIFIARFIIGVSSQVHRKKLRELIKDSQVSNLGMDDIELLLEELYSDEEKPLKLRDILKEN